MKKKRKVQIIDLGNPHQIRSALDTPRHLPFKKNLVLAYSLEINSSALGFGRGWSPSLSAIPGQGASNIPNLTSDFWKG